MNISFFFFFFIFYDYWTNNIFIFQKITYEFFISTLSTLSIRDYFDNIRLIPIYISISKNKESILPYDKNIDKNIFFILINNTNYYSSSCIKIIKISIFKYKSNFFNKNIIKDIYKYIF